MEEKLSTEEITLLREAIRIKYNNLKEEMERFGKIIKEADDFLEKIEGIYKFYGGKIDEQ